MELGKGTAVARRATAESKPLPSARGSASKKAGSSSGAAEVTKTEAAKGTALARRAAAERAAAMKAAAEQAMREAEAAEREALEAEALAMTVEATWRTQQGAAIVKDAGAEWEHSQKRYQTICR